jgi:mevalonate kinase
MKDADGEVFYGKIILFGEYTIIFESSAITLPLKRFSGKLQFFHAADAIKSSALYSNELLKKYLSYLDQPALVSDTQFPLDITRLRNDLEKGLYFNSNIPIGYGAGSSGALVAALFQRYCGNNKNLRTSEDPLVMNKIRDKLSSMESYFHGNSSGLDPLNSLLARPMLIESGKNISFIDLTLLPFLKDYKIFLIDTQQTRNTGPLVEWFKKQVSDSKIDIELLIAINNQVIKAVMNHNMLFFGHFINQLSLFQLENMQPMIPEKLSALWLEGIESGCWTLKLCGSGGGGYILGFTRDYTNTAKRLRNSGWTIISL